MKQLTIFCFLLLSIIGVRAENVISLSSVSGHPGDEVTVEVGFAMTDAVTAAEIIIPLDKQLTYVEGSATLNTARADGHELSAAVVNGNLRLYVYSLSLASLKGEEGTLASFKLKLKKEPADYTLTAQAMLSDAAGNSLNTTTEAGVVTLLSPKLTVVTTKIDYGHIPIRSTYTRTLTLQNSGNELLEVTGVVFSATEFFSDEENISLQPGENKSLTISYAPIKRGAIEETVSISSNAVNGVQKATLVADPFSVNELHVVGTSGTSDEEVEIALQVNNMEPLVGAQCTFTLPDALKYVEGSFTVAERASSHTATSSCANGKLTVILYSSTNTAFTGEDGAIGTFKVKLDGKSGTYTLKPEGVVLSNVTVENMTSATTSGKVVIYSPTLSSNASLAMGSTAITTPLTASYAVRNSGQAPLVIDKVTFLSEGFSLKTPLPLTIEKSKSGTLEVEYVPTREGDFSTTMNIYTNDPTNRMKAVAVSGTVYEPNRITVRGENQEDGSYDLTFGLENYTDVVAVQMDIKWLTGMTTSSAALIPTARLAAHSCTVADMGNGVYRVILYSMSNTPISGHTGDLFTLSYTPAGEVNCRDTELQVSNVVLSNPNGTDYASENTVNYKAAFTGFTVQFVLDDEVLSEQFLRVGTSLSIPEVSEKEGYSFSGWGDVPEVMPAQDLTFNGNYILNKYRLVYLVDSVEYKSCELEYGAIITAEAEPTKEGYTFSGWSEVPENMPAQDVTVTGSFTANTYKVTYILEGETFQTLNVVYGTTIPTPEVPAKEGYNFSGWGDIPATMPAQDLTFSGTYTVNKDLKYNLIYMVDGEEYKRVTLSFMDAITLETEPEKEGHTFSGWSEVPETMPLHDVTVTGTFTANSYTVTYILDGETFKTESVTYGTAITVPEVPTKEGYTFSGWGDVPATMPASDLTFNGSYTINAYTLIYEVDGVEYKTESLPYGATITAEAEPTKDGYTFSGWSEIPETMPAQDVTVTGSFTANSYTVTYILDGETFKTEQVTYGTVITTPTVPVKQGYDFSGWGEVPEMMPAKDLTFTGSYTINKNYKFNLIYMVDGVEYKSTILSFGDPIVLDAAPEKEGHTFSGWSEVPETMPFADVTVTGTFTANSYTVTYILDGETFKTEGVTYGTAITVPEVPTKEGYTFSGWGDVPATMPTSDLTFNGSYTINTYTLIYEVDGVEYKKIELEYGASITAEPTPTKEGHTFSGWSEIPETMPAQNVTVTGSFTANTYKVTYILDGETFQILNVVYGTTIPTPEVPAKEGYNFSGWGEVPATMPAKDLTFTGSYTINKNYKFNLIYMVDGVEYKSTILSFGDPIVLDAAPEKEGHTFSGWSEAPETMPFADVTVTGTFTANSYTVTYILDGETFKTESVTYGTAITVPEVPTKEGYTFSGWSVIPATMPAQDVTVTGSFTANSYTVTYILDGETFKTEQVVYGNPVVTPEVPAKEGYNFSGWGEVPVTMPAKDLILTGSYTINKDLKFNLIYMVDGVEYKRVTFSFGDAVTLEDEPTKEGHTFSGWSEVPETMPLYDVTVKGSFVANSYTVTYILDGETFKTETVIFGTAITTPEAPTKEGYSFNGWTGGPETMPANDVIITGNYTINSYTLLYMVDGIEYKKVELEYGASITAEAAPTKEGHTFSGWSEIPETMPAQDVMVTSSFIANSYTVTYILDGETFKTEQVTYGTVITTPTVPVKQGYDFSGWGEVPEMMPAKDLTFTGSYTINKDNVFNLIYMVDGREYTRVSVAFGDPIVLDAAPEKEGHTFSGWSEAPETMPFADVTVTGTFTANSYTVTYILDGETFKTESVTYGTAITVPEVPTKEGYTFSGWGDVPATMPASDLTFNGSYTINTYTLIYEVDGVEYKTESLPYGATITAEAEPTKEGYTFSGWSEIPETMPAQDVTVTGSFTANSYTVTYILDGETFKTEQVTYGTVITTPTVPVKQGYDFSGWGEVPEMMPAKDLTFTGSYTINKNYKFNLIYMVDGVEYKSTILSFGDPIVLDAAPEKEGHAFSGWSEVPETMPFADVTVTGTFTANSYTVTYILDGETFKTESVTYGTAITVPEVPTKEGYTFSGWGDVPATMPAGNLTFNGSYTVNTYTLTYKVDGVEYKTESLPYGATITAEAEPTKEGYTFSGWSEIPETMPAQDVTVTGSFTANSYTVTYILDGETFKTESVTYGTAITVPEVPTKEGYTFSGWGDVPATMPAQDLTFSGTYSVNKNLKYDLIYMVDGEEYKRVTLSFMDAITLEAEPEKEGHTFSGWSEVPETMPLHDVTVTGTFTANSYTLTYVLDGETFKTETVIFGTAITTPDVPTKEGYSFNGWTGVPETMPANDVTIEGRFAINIYKITYIVDGTEYATDSITYGESIILKEYPAKEGHTFSGWSEVPETMPAQNVTVEGTFAINTYKITYIVDGEVYAIEDVVYGTAVTPLDVPTKEGFIFSGWSEIPETMPAHDVEVTGEFASSITFITTKTHVDVYTLQGVMVKQQIPVEELERELPRGIYIIDGRKVALR